MQQVPTGIHYRLGTDERYILDQEGRRVQAAQLECKREQQQHEECPFRPLTNQNPDYTTNRSNSSEYFRKHVVDRLTQPDPAVIERKHQKLDEILQERQLKEEQDASFRPRILPQSRRMAQEMFGDAPLEVRLTQYQARKQENLEQERREREAEQELIARPGRVPVVGAAGPAAARSGGEASSATAFRRSSSAAVVGPREVADFYARQEQHLNDVQKKLAQAKEDQYRGCTFKPSINKVTASTLKASAARGRGQQQQQHQPQQQQQQRRSASASMDRASSRRADAAPAAASSFSTSFEAAGGARPGGALDDSGTVHDPIAHSERLYRDGLRRKEEQRQRAEEERELQERGACRFRPTINRNSEDMAANRHLDSDFAARQEQLAELARQRNQQLQEELQRQQVSGFLPRHIDNAQLQRHIDRLHDKSTRLNDDLKASLQQRVFEEACPFQPQLSDYHHHHHGGGSSGGGGDAAGDGGGNRRDPRAVVERLYRVPTTPREQQRQQQQEDEEYQRRQSEERANGSMTVTQFADFYNRQLVEKQRREQQLHNAKRCAAVEEALACTFRPRVNEQTPNQRRRNDHHSQPQYQQQQQRPATAVSGGGAHEIKGMDRFLDRQESAKRMKRETEEKLKNTGRGMPCNGPNYTVFVPFNISWTAANKKRR